MHHQVRKHRMLGRWNTALAMVLCMTGAVRSAHYSGGAITYSCLGGGNYEVTLNLFRDCSGFNMVPQTLTFSSDCGLTFSVNALPVPPGVEVSQLCPSQLANSTCNGGALPGMQFYQFTTTVFLPPCDDWTISWNICCWALSNNVVGTPQMYLETIMDNLNAPCNGSPVFNDQSIPYVCVNQPVYYSYSVTEPDGDSLSFSLIGAQTYSGGPVPITYQPGFSGINPVNAATLDPVTGQLTFLPTVTGNYLIAVQVNEYDASGLLIGTTIREQMFVVMNCTGTAPVVSGLSNNTAGLLVGANSVQVCDGQAFCVDLVLTDADPGTVLNVTSNAAALLPGSTFTISGTNPVTATLCWTGDVSNSPVNVFVEVNDGACPVMNVAGTSITVISVTGGAMAPDPGVDATVQVCSNGAVVDLFTALGGTPDPGGMWSDPGGASHSNLFDPVLDPFGTYTYTVGNACANASAAVTVQQQTAPEAGTNGSYTTCSSAGAFNLIAFLGGAPSAGGSWTAPGGAAHSNVYSPATDAPGVYTYTVLGVAPCGSASATVTITENAAPNAGADGSITLCSNGAAVNLFASLAGAQAGGTWTAPGGAAFGGTYDPAVNIAGAYTYTVAGVTPCANDQATVTVTENAAPNAGVDGSITVCSNGAAVNLFASLTGAQAGGTWTAPGGAAFSGTYDPALNNAGAYTYTVAGAAPCANDQATVTVTENAAPNAGADGSITLCSNGAAVNLFASLAGAQAGGTWTAPGGAAFSGTYDPAVNNAGAYTYTVAGAAPCANDQATVTVTENAAPIAGADGSITLCSSGAAVNLFASLTGAQAGGTWTAPGGAAFSGTYDPAVNNSGAYIYTVAGVAPCANDQATVTVTENAAPNAGADGSIIVCSNGATVNLVASLVGAQAGGTWTAPGGAAFSGTYDPAVNNAGVYTYTVVGAAPCANDQATVTVTENAAPNAGADGSITVCDIGTPVNLFASLVGAQAGGTWTAPGGGAHSGSYDPLVDAPGAYTYVVFGSAPCANDQAQVTVAETSTPDAGGDGSIALCSTDAPVALFSLLVAADPGGSWTEPGGASHTGTLNPSIDPPGVYTYDLVATAPCVSDQSTVTVGITAAPDAGGDGAAAFCDNGAPVALFSALLGTPDAGGTWSAPGGAPFSGVFDPAIDPPGAYSYTVSGAAPCLDDAATITVVVQIAPDAGVDGAVTLCSTAAPVALFTLLSGADIGGTWTAPGGGAHSGSLDPSIDPPGTYTYSLSAMAPCAPDQSMVSVTIDPASDAGSDNSVLACPGDPAFALFALIGGTPDAGGTWTDPLGAASTGVFDPAVSPIGAYTYIVVNGSCAPDQSVLTVALSSGPNAGADNAVALCETGPVVDMLGLLAGTPDPGGIWSDSGGNAVSNLFDPSAGTGGVFTYTLTGVGSCTTASAQLTLVVNTLTNAGSAALTTLCGNGAAVNLFALIGGSPSPGGTWTDPLGNPFTGTFDPATGWPGDHVYTVAGAAPCPSSSTIVSVTVVPPADAGDDSSATLCQSDPPVQLMALLGGTPQSGGTWTDPMGVATSAVFDPQTGPVGTYTYAVAGLGPCASDQSALTIGVSAAADAGLDAAITVCDDAAAFDLFAQLGGAPDVGGSWTDAAGDPVNVAFDPTSDVAGTFTYTVTAPAPCPQDVSSVQVVVVAVPSPLITMTTLSGCAPVLASFSTDYTGSGTFTWDLGNGVTSSDAQPDSVLYTTPGTYAITLTIDPGAGCASTTVLSPALMVADEPLAEFIWSPQIITTTNAQVFFQDASQGASAWAWDFSGLGFSDEEDPSFTFSEAEEGVYDVCLMAFSSPECYDTVCHRIEVLMGSTIFVPNSFTPDGDGANDLFGPSALGVKDYRFTIYDRWGRLLFESGDPGVRWNGEFAGGGPVPEGVYVWQLHAEDPFHPEGIERTGHVTLLR